MIANFTSNLSIRAVDNKGITIEKNARNWIFHEFRINFLHCPDDWDMIMILMITNTWCYKYRPLFSTRYVLASDYKLKIKV